MTAKRQLEAFCLAADEPAGKRFGLASRTSAWLTNLDSAPAIEVWCCLFSWFLLVSTAIWLLIPATLATIAIDSAGFHVIATDLLAKMRLDGWRAWEPWPQGQAPAGISAALYYVTGVSSPMVVVPLLSAIHASSAIVLDKLVRAALGGRPTYYLPAILMALLPSSILTATIAHKDPLAILGIFCILFSFHLVRDNTLRSVRWLKVGLAAACLILGAVLVFIVRPYLLSMILAAAIVLSAAMLAIRLVEAKKFNLDWGRLALALSLAIGLLVATSRFLTATIERDNYEALCQAPAVATAIWWLPRSLETEACILAGTRKHFLQVAPEAASNIDANVQLEDALDVLAYTPRALQIGMLAPFPDAWLSKNRDHGGSVAAAASTVEMLFYYTCLLSICLGAAVSRSARALLPTVLFCLAIVTIYAIAVPNVGTLYRERLFSVLIICGGGLTVMGGWLVERRWRLF